MSMCTDALRKTEKLINCSRLILILTALCCLLCGCHGRKSGETLEQQADSSAFCYGINSTTNTLDSFHDSSLAVRTISDALHGFLVWWDEDSGGLKGELASDWRWISKKEIIIILNRDFRFSNGRAVVASDVVYTFERIMDPTWDSYKYSMFSDIIESVTERDDYAVRICLKRPSTMFLYWLTGVPILCEESIETLSYAPVGCGPFSFMIWVSEDELVMKRSPYYPKTGARYAQYEKLTLAFYDTDEELFEAFASGEVDAMSIAAYDILSVAADTDAYIQGGLVSTAYLAGNQNNDILRTPGVMQAIKYAVDPDEIVNLALYGFGEVTLAPLQKDSISYPAELAYPRDLELAGENLSEAGYPDGFSVKLIVPNQDCLPHVAYAIKEHLSKINISVEVEEVSIGDFSVRWQSGDYELAVNSTAITWNPLQEYRQWTQISQTNYINYDNRKYNEYYQLAINATGSQTQEQYIKLLQKELLSDAVVQYLVNYHSFLAVHPQWSDIELHGGVVDLTSARLAVEGDVS